MDKFKFKLLALVVLTALMVSCSKSGDDNIVNNDEVIEELTPVENFLRTNRLNVKDFPNVTQSMPYKMLDVDPWWIYSSFQCFCGFKNNTDDFYIWFCDESSKIVSQVAFEIPKVITKNKGYGIIEKYERKDGPYDIQIISKKNELELLSLHPSYYNWDKITSYVIGLKSRKITVQYIEDNINDAWEMIDWYNNSYLIGTTYSSNFYCFSENLELISQYSVNWNSVLHAILTGGYYIPLNYTEVLYPKYEMANGTDFELYYEKINGEGNNTFSVASPFGTKENYIFNSFSLLESNGVSHLVECQFTAYSGEKKTVKIRINTNEKSAKIVE